MIGPGGPYFKLPWQRVYKVTVATQTLNIAFDPESATANNNNQVLEAVTKDQLNTGLTGQLRYTIAERNLYATLFAVKNPIAHVMGYFVSILRERIANFDAPPMQVTTESAVAGRRQRRTRRGAGHLDQRPAQEPARAQRADGQGCARRPRRATASGSTRRSSPASIRRGGRVALAAINTAHNEVSSDISVAQASADQRIVQSKRAVQIETLNAQAEVEPLNWLAAQLTDLRKNGPRRAVRFNLRNIRLALYAKASHIILEMKK